MINKNELRFGNKIYFGVEEKIIIEVETIHKDGVNESFSELDVEYPESEPVRNVYEYDALFGIPLTAEILERSGFEKQAGDHWRINFFFEKKIGFELANRWIRIDQVKSSKGGPDCFWVFFLENHRYSFEESAMIREVGYVHQLQNLMFIFDGQELEIKELSVNQIDAIGDKLDKQKLNVGNYGPPL